MRMVPLAGLEPAQCCHYLILSQARLPIPPQGQAGGIIAAKRGGSTARTCRACPGKRAPFFRNEAQIHARARAGAQGSGARSCLLSAIAGPLVWLWVLGLVEFTLGPRVARTRGLARDTRRQRVAIGCADQAPCALPRHASHHRVRAR